MFTQGFVKVAYQEKEAGVVSNAIFRGAGASWRGAKQLPGAAANLVGAAKNKVFNQAGKALGAVKDVGSKITDSARRASNAGAASFREGLRGKTTGEGAINARLGKFQANNPGVGHDVLHGEAAKEVAATREKARGKLERMQKKDIFKKMNEPKPAAAARGGTPAAPAAAAAPAAPAAQAATPTPPPTAPTPNPKTTETKPGKAKKEPGFIRKHPFISAGLAYGGMRMMSGGDQQPPPPPPQVVQY